MNFFSLVAGKVIAESSGGSGGGAALNIAYGDTAPGDKSKLWIKAEEPKSIVFGSDFDGVESVESLPTNIPTAYDQMASARVGENIYLFGGKNGSSTYSNYIYKFNTKDHSLKRLSVTLSANYYGLIAVANGTKIYLFGGIQSGSQPKHLQIFDTVEETLQTVTNALPSSIYNGCGVSVDNIIYVFSRNTSIMVYDTSLGKVSTIPSGMDKMPQYATCQKVGKYVYIIGGRPAGTGYSDAILVFDTETQTMSTHPTVLPVAIQGATSGVVGNKIFIFGGYAYTTTDEYFDNIYVFDTMSGSIETVGTIENPSVLPTPAYNIASETYGNEIYLFGGCIGANKQINTISKFSLTHDLAENNIEVITAYKNFFNIINSNSMKVEIGVDSVLIGNEENHAKVCEAYLHNGTDWQQI